MSASGNSHKRKRAQKACHFCHERKLKCDKNGSDCSNCVTYDRKCVYDKTPKKSRPSNKQIAQLEAENQRLQTQLAQRTSNHQGKSVSRNSHGSDASTSSDGSRSAHHAGQYENMPHNHTSLSNVKDVAQVIDFYGPSSILFDELPREQDSSHAELISEVSNSHDSAQLMAEAATQRRFLPSVNFVGTA